MLPRLLLLFIGGVAHGGVSLAPRPPDTGVLRAATAVGGGVTRAGAPGVVRAVTRLPVGGGVARKDGLGEQGLLRGEYNL